ncbi:MAG TPA: hypothetical protein VHT24_16340 [Pseudacidobacterium sp.]|jgi:sRNA-binding regulator protein Hfq|nr:hypothetical protein [Pseudacidobacterium sp.]
MANPSLLPSPDESGVRSVDSALASDAKTSADQPAPMSLAATGPRKLIRPTLPTRALNKNLLRRNGQPLLAHHEMMTSQNGQESSHAESFYFQKQAQSQTPMVFILEDGERIEGYIEWYDLNSIKVRNHTRVLIYKSSIKYLYKAQDRDKEIVNRD